LFLRITLGGKLHEATIPFSNNSCDTFRTTI
jgi:hypothetical protein